MIKSLICDLDGPILDGRERHHHCYSKILKDGGYVPMDINTYWDMKRRHRSLKEQLEASGAGSFHEDFYERWLRMIELPEVLELERLQHGAYEKLGYWKDQGIRLVLVTMRQSTANLHQQLSRMKLEVFWEKVLVSEHLLGAKGKAMIFRSEFPLVCIDECLWIGDTEIDTEAANDLGCRSCFVNCGIRDKNYLGGPKPDFIVDNLAGVELSSGTGARS